MLQHAFDGLVVLGTDMSLFTHYENMMAKLVAGTGHFQESHDLKKLEPIA